MARQNLGIIQIDLPNITLDDDFGSYTRTDITDLLSNEQKENIKKAFQGSKIVYVNLKGIVDASENSIGLCKLIPCYVDKTLNIISLGTLVTANDTNPQAFLVCDFDSEPSQISICM